MSLYEMTMKTEVKAVTQAQRQKYGVTLTDNDRSTRGRAFTRKAPLLAHHTKAQSHWISFFMKDHTPVIYGCSMESTSKRLTHRTDRSSSRQ